MKRWLCTVCGYIHVGETPPDTCPQCGAPNEKFVSMEDQDASMNTAQAALQSETAQSMKGAAGQKSSLTVYSAADVIVVGSGAAAFAAAVTARNEGCSVIMLLKCQSIWRILAYLNCARKLIG